MTKAEAAAMMVVFDWIFSTPKNYRRARFKSACLLLALGVEQQGGRWTRKRVEEQRW